MRNNTRVLYTAPKDTEFNIFMSGPEWGQPVIRAQDIVKNMMDRRNKKHDSKISALDQHKYPDIPSRPSYTANNYPGGGRKHLLKPMS